MSTLLLSGALLQCLRLISPQVSAFGCDDTYAFDCALPADVGDFALITEEDAEFAAQYVDKGMAIGGAFTQLLPQIGMIVDGESFIWSIPSDIDINVNWGGGLHYPAPLSAKFDFELFKDVARHAKASARVFVLTHGGEYSCDDFGDGVKTLVVFNTDEQVTLNRADYCSVLAPFSEVNLIGGHIGGWLIAKSFKTDPVRMSMELYGFGFDGTLSCDTSSEQSPTSPPTSSTTPGQTPSPTPNPTPEPTSSTTHASSTFSIVTNNAGVVAKQQAPKHDVKMPEQDDGSFGWTFGAALTASIAVVVGVFVVLMALVLCARRRKMEKNIETIQEADVEADTATAA